MALLTFFLARAGVSIFLVGSALQGVESFSVGPLKTGPCESLEARCTQQHGRCLSKSRLFSQDEDGIEYELIFSEDEDEEEVIEFDCEDGWNGEDGEVMNLPNLDFFLKDTRKLAKHLPYFYLQNELEFSEDTMLKVTYEAGSTFQMRASTVREKIEVLRDCMGGLENCELEQMINYQPTLLHLSARENLEPTAKFLAEEIGLSKEQLKQLVMGNPAVLAYSERNLQRKIHFFRHDMMLSKKDCRDILLKEPKLFSNGVKMGMLPRLRFLNREMEFPMASIRSLCMKHPRILMKSLDQNLRPKFIFFFIMTLHMSPKEVLKLVSSYPHIIEYNLDNHILPITRYFLSLDISAHELARMLLKFPRLVTHSLKKIKRTVGYLRYELGLEASDVRRVLYQAPQVVGLTIANLQAKVDFLSNVVPSVRKLIIGMPTLLLLNPENNLQPKLDYLSSELGNEELIEALGRLPTLLGYSFEKRIRPRLEAIKEAGVIPGSITVGISMKQENFESWLQGREKKARKQAELANIDKLQDSEATATRTPASTPGLVVASDVSPIKLKSDKSDGKLEGRIRHWTRDRR